MQNVDILIVIEHLSRELESACLLKTEFEKRGYKVMIESIYPNKEKLPFRYQTDCLFIPWAYHDQDMAYWECFYHTNPNTMIINLHHEQYSGNDHNNTTLPQGRAKNIFHLSWGKQFTDGLIEKGVDPKRIITAGNLRLDFYRPPLTQLSVSKAQLASHFQIDEKKDWILFIANAYHLMYPSEKANARQIDKDVDIKCQVSSQNREYFLTMVKHYLTNHKDKIFIYRPHPAYARREYESVELTQLCNQFPNQFKVIYANALRDWILASQCCLSFHSTSGIECSLAKVPFYLLRVVPLDSSLDYSFYHQFPNVIKNEEEFIHIMQTDGQLVDPIQFSKHYYMHDCPAYQILVDWVETHNEFEHHQSHVLHRLQTHLKANTKDTLRFIARTTPVFSFFQSKLDGRWSRLLQSHDDLLEPSRVEQLCQQIQSLTKEEST